MILMCALYILNRISKHGSNSKSVMSAENNMNMVINPKLELGLNELNKKLEKPPINTTVE